MSNVEFFPLIEVSGDARERGRQYGRQASERIRRSVRFYGGKLAAMGRGPQQLEAIVQKFLPEIERFDPLYLEEMKGIAEGAGLTLQEIVLINARTEVLRLSEREAKKDQDRLLTQADPDGCTGAAILPEMTAHGRLLHGQNWDWRHECAETGIVLKIRREDGPDILTFTEAGGLARSGLNSAGIAVTANFLSCDRDYLQLGVPLALIRRKVLETEHIALALHAVYTTPKTTSNNLIVSHAGGFAMDIECAPDESFIIQPTNGLIVHANHWQSPVALSKVRDTGIATSPDSLYRDVRVRQQLSGDNLTIEHMRNAFFDTFASPWSVCRPARKTVESHLSATVAMILMDPQKGHLEIAPLPAVNRQFASYSLTMDQSFVQVAEPA